MHARAQVILARVVETGEVVAIKRIHIQKSSNGGLPDNVLREVKSLQVKTHRRATARPPNASQAYCSSHLA
jgi:hypothetical protein